MSQFGKWGRAGNQFFQYSLLTGYAKKHDLELQIPTWVGNQLFGTKDEPVSSQLPPWIENGKGLEHPTPPKGEELIGKDYRGYAQYHTSYYVEGKHRIQELFQPVPSIQERLTGAIETLKRDNVLTIGIHIRRGDYGRNIFPLVPLSWYQKWLKHHTVRLGRFRLFLATEDPSVIPDFRQYNPETVETLGIDLAKEPMANCTYLERDLQTKDTRALDWYPDFHLLSKCDIILGGSSTFSFFAAMLNPSFQEYWRASLAVEQFEKTDPWNSYPLLREDCRDYPHIEGITSDKSNPYW
jgi:hypothetical protein